MAQQVHFEIFSRRGAGGWKLVEVKTERDASVKQAQELMTEGVTGVKVVKETYNEDTGDFLSLKIFEDGNTKLKVAPSQEDVPNAVPCFRPEDLYSYHARQTIARLIPDFLSRNKVTVTELIHRADLLEKFEATGTLLQHAIQKVAVAQAASTTQPVQQIVKTLNELTTKAFHRVYRDHRKQLFPEVAEGAWGPLAAKLISSGEGAYLLNGAIARMLRTASGWDEKVARLIALMDEADDGPGGVLLLASVDGMIAETLGGSAALQDLIGKKDNLGAALMSLVELFLGQEPAEGGKQGLIALTQRFSRDDLPSSRSAIAERIIAEFKSVKRLCPESLFDEFKMLRKIANRVVMGIGKYLSHEDLIAAFTLRSKRLINQVTLGDYLADSAGPDEKLERLLFVEENIIGAENKRQLATFVVPILTATSFEIHFMSPKLPALARLQRLGELSARVRRSGFQEIQKREIADHLDRISCDVAASCKFFESFESKPVSHVEKALTILRLFASDSFTEPKLAAKARDKIIVYLSKPGFLTGYVAQITKGGTERPNPDACVAELMKTLERAGITQETGLRSIAA